MREAHSAEVRKRRQACKEGFTLLQLVEGSYHDVGFHLQASDGACFDGLRFRTCDPNSGGQICGAGIRFGGKGDVNRFLYRWHDPTKCLARDGVDTKLGACTDGGAKQWGLKHGQLSQNDGKHCVVRALDNMAHMVDCSKGHEYVSLALGQSQATTSETQSCLQQQEAVARGASRSRF